MRKIASNYIFLPNSKLLLNSYVIMNDDGVLQKIVDTKGVLVEIEKLEFYSGLLVPSYVANNLPSGNIDLLAYLSQLYSKFGSDFRGLAILYDVDFLKMESLSSIYAELL